MKKSLIMAVLVAGLAITACGGQSKEEQASSMAESAMSDVSSAAESAKGAIESAVESSSAK